MSRPLVSVYSATTGLPVGDPLPLPKVFETPVRDDVVQQVFTLMNKNRRQAHGVYTKAGHETAAESWGTGRAVSRIPRVPGGGTHRSGQGAFGNMCRGGHMFAPNKIWRRWHRKININLKRYATSCAVAATGVAALVMARGHKVQHLPEVPLVVCQKSLVGVNKSKKAAEVLKKIGAWADVERVVASHGLRAGKGKMRNRRFVQRKGPLVVYKNKGSIVRAFRNIPGVDLCCVDRLNLLTLAPGGHLGRFVIWTSDAFKALDTVFSAKAKHGFNLPQAKLSNASITRIMRSEEVKAALRAPKKTHFVARKKNPLANFGVMMKLNPYQKVATKKAILNMKRIAAVRAKVAKKVAAKKAGLPVKKGKLEKKTEKGKGFFCQKIKKAHDKKVLNKRIAASRKSFRKLLFC